MTRRCSYYWVSCWCATSSRQDPRSTPPCLDWPYSVLPERWSLNCSVHRHCSLQARSSCRYPWPTSSVECVGCSSHCGLKVISRRSYSRLPYNENRCREPACPLPRRHSRIDLPGFHPERRYSPGHKSGSLRHRSARRRCCRRAYSSTCRMRRTARYRQACHCRTPD